MEPETATARVIQRIAVELGVPASSFYERDAVSLSGQEAMRKAVAALLNAFAVVRDPSERQRCLGRLSAETMRLRALAEDGEG